MEGADSSRNGRKRWHGDQSGRWTHRLISELATWLYRKYGQVGFYLAQALLSHGCFNAYLKRFKKRDDESCRYCGSLVENAEHTLFVPGGARTGRLSVGLWAHNSLLTRWSPSCVLAGLGSPRLPGEESAYSSLGWRG